MKAAKTLREQQKLQSVAPNSKPYAELMIEIAERNPKASAAVDALVWAYRHGFSRRAKEILMRDHLLAPQIGPLCRGLAREPGDPGAFKALNKVLNENPSKEAQAHAALALGRLLKSRADYARDFAKADAPSRLEMEQKLSKDLVAVIKNAEPASLEKQAEELLERVTKNREFSEIKTADGEKLGDLAAPELYELRHLRPGKVAPEIIGEDIDGKPMKLSDFRGKVVLLDFWGFW